MKTTKNRTIWKKFSLLILFLLISCASNNFEMKQPDSSDDNTGLVFGYITLQEFFGIGARYGSDAPWGKGVSFKNIKTKKETLFRGAHYFALHLQEGNYELTGIGSRTGGLAPKAEPFSFSVKDGDIKYIGAIVGDRDLIFHLEEIGKIRPVVKTDIVSMKEYGPDRGFLKPTGKGSEPFIKFFVIDKSEHDISKFLSDFPQYQKSDVTVELMR